MFYWDNLLNKLNYNWYNILIVIIIPILYAYTLHVLASIILIIASRKIIAKWGDKEVSLNNERS